VKGHLAKHYREFDIRAPWETKNERATQMTAEEIKQQFPDVHAAILDNGKKAGCAEERDRVTAHLTLGEQSGDMKTALAAIASGDGMTQTLQAKYMAAGMNRQATATRQADSDAAAKVLADAAPPAAADAAAVEDLGDKVVALLEKQLGKGKKVA
jgi:hypothetical protein